MKETDEVMFDEYGLSPILKKQNFTNNLLELLTKQLNDHLDKRMSNYLNNDEEKKASFSIEASMYLGMMMMHSRNKKNNNVEFFIERTNEICDGYATVLFDEDGKPLKVKKRVFDEYIFDEYELQPLLVNQELSEDKLKQLIDELSNRVDLVLGDYLKDVDEKNVVFARENWCHLKTMLIDAETEENNNVEFFRKRIKLHIDAHNKYIEKIEKKNKDA
jgi:hypothetical protein